MNHEIKKITIKDAIRLIEEGAEEFSCTAVKESIKCNTGLEVYRHADKNPLFLE